MCGAANTKHTINPTVKSLMIRITYILLTSVSVLLEYYKLKFAFGEHNASIATTLIHCNY